MSYLRPIQRFASIRLANVLNFMFLMCLFAGVTSAVTEKTSTNLTIEISPEEPALGETFYVTGVLIDEKSKTLGNKRVILQSAETSTEEDEAFENLETRETERDGSYKFFRSEKSKPEFIRVSFGGNDQYEPVTSLVIAIRGAGTDHPLVQTNLTGSIKVSTNPQGAQIFVDGILRGITPNTIARLPEGNHVLTIEKTGYHSETTEAFVTSKMDNAYDYSLKKSE